MATAQNLSELLTQSQPAVVVPITSVPRRITQDELQELLLLRRKAETLEALEADLKQRLQAGATVEDGVHIARLKPGSRRNVAVLNSTKPTPTLSLIVE